MAGDLRAIDRAPGPEAAAPHWQALRDRTLALTPDMLRQARNEAALAPHAGDFAAFVAGTVRFLAEGGHPRAVPALDRVSRLGAALACTPPDIRRAAGPTVGTGIAAAPAAAGGMAPRPAMVSGVFLGPPRHRVIFYLGALTLAVAIVAVHLRNQRYARLSARHHCHISTRIRRRGEERGTVVQDISRMGATIRGDSLRIDDRLWLRIGQAWLSTRVIWRTRHFAGVGFDHPIGAAQLDRALAETASEPTGKERISEGALVVRDGRPEQDGQIAQASSGPREWRGWQKVVADPEGQHPGREAPRHRQEREEQERAPQQHPRREAPRERPGSTFLH
ncbi:hypothetical protein E0K89_015070 [Aquicoccus sp. SCR17]|nr:hypothetical protein [Carideicomes alvinocaridis]